MNRECDVILGDRLSHVCHINESTRFVMLLRCRCRCARQSDSAVDILSSSDSDRLSSRLSVSIASFNALELALLTHVQTRLIIVAFDSNVA